MYVLEEYALHCKYLGCELLHKISNWIHDIVCHPLVLLQMNGSEVRLSAFVFGIVSLAAMTTYKCHANQMDSMVHVRDSVPMVYSYKLYPMVGSEDCHLQKTQCNLINIRLFNNESHLITLQHFYRKKFANRFFRWQNKLLYLISDKKLQLLK